MSATPVPPKSSRLLPRPPVLIDPVVEDPAALCRLVEARAPYWPVQRYFGNDAEYAALSGRAAAAPMVVAPVFRGNWAVEGQADPDVAPLLHHARFVDAARRLFDGEIVRPTTVYVNLTWQLPFAQGVGHTDIPAFRGLDRTRCPVTWLSIMGLSGLFEDVRLRIATAVAWFYPGLDGGFEYWPEGPDGPARIHEGRIENTAIVGDNDFMWHRVRPTGSPRDGMARLSLESELTRDDGYWVVRQSGGVGGNESGSENRNENGEESRHDGRCEVGRFDWDVLRVSLSWKALVFASDRDARRHDEHTDDIDLAEVLRRYDADLRARGIELAWPADPVHDAETIARLSEVYVRYPAASPRVSAASSRPSPS